jgi:hypothetical protein
MLAHNPIGKYDKPTVYASRLLNKENKNNITIEKEALAMVYALHKFKLFLMENKFVFLCRPHGFGILGQQTACV